MDLIDTPYSQHINLYFLECFSGYLFELPTSGNIKSLSLVITAGNLSVNQIRDYLSLSKIYLHYRGYIFMYCRVLDGLFLSLIKGRKVKTNNVGQLIVPVDFWVEECDNMLNCSIYNHSKVLLSTREMPFKIQLRVKYYSNIDNTLMNDWGYVFSANWSTPESSNNSCTCFNTELIVIYGNIELDVLSIQYELRDIIHHNSRTVVSNHVIQKRIWGTLYNIIPINYQYMDMKEICDDHLMRTGVEEFNIKIDNIISIPTISMLDMNICSINHWNYSI